MSPVRVQRQPPQAASQYVTAEATSRRRTILSRGLSPAGGVNAPSNTLSTSSPCGHAITLTPLSGEMKRCRVGRNQGVLPPQVVNRLRANPPPAARERGAARSYCRPPTPQRQTGASLLPPFCRLNVSPRCPEARQSRFTALASGLHRQVQRRCEGLLRPLRHLGLQALQPRSAT